MTMIQLPLPLIEQIIDVEVVSPPPGPGDEAKEDWLDRMILVGRLYVGPSRREHVELCQAIEADRAMRRLVYRLQAGARAACR